MSKNFQQKASKLIDTINEIKQFKYLFFISLYNSQSLSPKTSAILDPI